MKTKIKILIAVLFVSIASGSFASIHNVSTCAGTPLTIGNVVPGGIYYSWNTTPVQYGSSITVNPSSNQQYVETIENIAHQFIVADTFNVTINPLPNATATASPASICMGANTTLTATGGTSYYWNTGIALSSFPIAPIATTPYFVTVTNSFGCSNTAQTTVTVNPLPTVTAGSNSPVCAGNSILLNATASPISTFSWTGPNGFTSSSPIIGNATVAMTGTYLVTATTSAGCSQINATTVIVNNPPTIAVNSNATTICSGNSLMLLAIVSSGTVSWTGPNGFTSNSQNPIINNVTTAMSGSYIASVTSGGCTVTGNVNITVNQTPTVAITGPSALCYGGSGTLIANSGGTYVWSTGATTAAINITPITTTTYTVTTTNLNGCTATASSVVTVNQMPAPIISPASATICTGDNVTLNVSGGTNYLWSNGSTGIALTVSPTTTTTYNIMASNGGCTATNTVTVTVNQTPTASISPASATICNGENALLLANGGGTYQWNNGAATNLIVVAPATTTTYTVIVTNLNGCTATASSMVTVNPAPTASITGNLNTCPGANTTLTAIGGNTYVWSTGSNAQIITVNPNTTTTYTVTVSNTNGCKSSTSVQVNVYPSPTATITPSSLTICQGTNGVLTATGGVSYLWSTGQPTATITVSPPATTNYNVIVTDGNGCKASAITTVIVNHISSYFSYAAEVSCPGGNNGYANIAVNGQYPYAYWWSPTPTSGQGTSSVNNLTAGVWNVQITDANGCVTNNSITILQPPQIVITPSINNQTVTVSVSGGTLLGSNQYQYLWSPTPVAGYGASTATFAEGVTHVQLTVTDGHECQETAMMTLSGGVGINEMTTESPINIYPNPVSDVLYIETGNIEVSEIQIFDVQGKMITLSGSTTTVDMAKMPTGIYLLRIITKDGDMFSSKVMKE